MEHIAKKILKILESNGYKAYIVGGFVRDKLMGIESLDIDIATNASTKVIKELFPKSITFGERHGTISVKMSNHFFEITTFRTESDYFDNRHPEKILFVDTVEEDLHRRDFTVNALAMDIDDNIIDLFSGIIDINKGLIKAVGNPYTRFSEDALRIMRAIRFVSQLGFMIDEETLESLKKLKDTISNISIERVKQEFERILTGRFKDLALELMIELDIKMFREFDEVFRFLIGSKLSLIESWALIYYLTKINLRDWKMSNKDRRRIINIAYLIDDLNNLNPYMLYKNKEILLEASNVKFVLEGMDLEEDINELLCNQVITSRDDLEITGDDIKNLGARGSEVGKMLDLVEYEVVNGVLENSYKDIIEYIRRRL